MKQLKAYAAQYGLDLTPEMLAQFETYQRLLLEGNQRINLTAITAPPEILEKHFLDSIIPLRFVPQGARVIDVGTGAGFPGLPMKIARPDIQLTLIDSLNKRVNFLWEVSQALGQQNQALHARAEQAAHDPDLREKFDIATARAVAPMSVLCELCLGFVRVGGSFLALKAGGGADELSGAQQAAEILCGSAIAAHDYQLPNFGQRAVWIVEKTSQTSSTYPRKYARITKAPL